MIDWIVFFLSDLCQHRNLFFSDRQVVDGCAWWVRELLGGSVGPWAGSPTIANTTHQHFLLSDACQRNNLVQWVVSGSLGCGCLCGANENWQGIMYLYYYYVLGRSNTYVGAGTIIKRKKTRNTYVKKKTEQVMQQQCLPGRETGSPRYAKKNT